MCLKHWGQYVIIGKKKQGPGFVIEDGEDPHRHRTKMMKVTQSGEAAVYVKLQRNFTLKERSYVAEHYT
jgi:hypothetical protein